MWVGSSFLFLTFYVFALFFFCVCLCVCQEKEERRKQREESYQKTASFLLSNPMDWLAIYSSDGTSIS